MFNDFGLENKYLLWAPRKGPTITSGVHCRQLSKIEVKYRSFYGRTRERCGPMLLHDNARPHTSNQTYSCLSDLNFEELSHPLYSLNMGFSFIPALAAFPQRLIFHWYRGGKKLPEWFFASRPLGLYYSGMHKLIKWHVYHWVKRFHFVVALFHAKWANPKTWKPK